MTETQPEVVTMDDSDDDQPAAAAAAKPARSSRAVATQPKAAPKQAKPAAAGKSQKKAPKQAAAAAAPAVAAAAGAQFTAEELQLVRGRLLAWYDEHHRVLPWRRTPHSKRTLPAPSGPHEVAHPAPADLDAQAFAYRVWVSEVMLQQTQVATVIPYFDRWVAKWPTVRDLAGADVEAVNAMWAGLGYYRRARYLLDGAKYVVEQLQGEFPTNAKDLLAIPGVGPYTSAAVASIAFGDAAAVVDGNVVRVVSRLRALGGDPTKLGAAHARLAQAMLDTDRPGDFNQAVMELGARVCRPVAPDCGTCPVAGACAAWANWQAYLEGGGCPDIEDAPRVTMYPGKKQVKAKKEQLVLVCALELVTTRAAPAPPRATLSPAGESQPPGKPAAAAKAADAPAQQKQQQQPRKRQASMLAFLAAPSGSSREAAAGGGSGADAPVSSSKAQRTAASTSASTRAPAAAAEKGEGGQQGGGSGGGELPVVPMGAAAARLLADPQSRRVLLVQRPAQGLLAGLWELPGVEVAGAGGDDEDEEAQQGKAPSSYARRKELVDAHLRALLGGRVHVPGITEGAQGGPGQGQGSAVPSAVVMQRRDAGEYVHVFSHVRQRNLVERLVLVTDDLAGFEAAVCGTGAGAGSGAKEQEGPVMRWSWAHELQDAGVSTGPLKMHAQACGEEKGGKRAAGGGGGGGAGGKKGKQ